MPKRPTLGTHGSRPASDPSPASAPGPTAPASATSPRPPRARRVPASFSAPSGTGRWLRGIHFSAFSIVMMGILVTAVVVLAPTIHAYAQQQQQIADQQRAVSQLSAQVGVLKDQRARWNDPSYIRAQARDRLYYVMPGEVSYLVIDDRPPAAQESATPVSSKLQKTKTDWVGSLFGSFMGAGLTDATPAQLGATTPAPPANPAPAPTPARK